MSNTNIEIPISLKDNYILDTFKRKRYLFFFNRHIRGMSIPIGRFHLHLHDQTLYDCDSGRDKRTMSLISNKYNSREFNFNGVVKALRFNEKNNVVADVQWLDVEEPPKELRITAVLCGDRLIRIMQFGVE